MHSIHFWVLNAKLSAYVSITLCLFHYIDVLKPIQLIIILCWKGFGPIGLFLRTQRRICKLKVYDQHYIVQSSHVMINAFNR